jgi:hypothetical protein
MAIEPPFEYWQPWNKAEPEAVVDHREFAAREIDRSDKRPRNVTPDFGRLDSERSPHLGAEAGVGQWRRSGEANSRSSQVSRRRS